MPYHQTPGRDDSLKVIRYALHGRGIAANDQQHAVQRVVPRQQPPPVPPLLHTTRQPSHR